MKQKYRVTVPRDKLTKLSITYLDLIGSFFESSFIDNYGYNSTAVIVTQIRGINTELNISGQWVCLVECKPHWKESVIFKEIVFDEDLANNGNRETDGSAMITPYEDGHAPFKVDHQYVHKHKPEVDGYYVVYEGGYESWSPADAFEGGYTKLP